MHILISFNISFLISFNTICKWGTVRHMSDSNKNAVYFLLFSFSCLSMLKYYAFNLVLTVDFFHDPFHYWFDILFCGADIPQSQELQKYKVSDSETYSRFGKLEDAVRKVPYSNVLVQQWSGVVRSLIRDEELNDLYQQHVKNGEKYLTEFKKLRG